MPPAAPEIEDYLPKGEVGRAGQFLARGAEVPSRWWLSLQSSALNRLIDDALAFNADLEAAEHAVRVAEANALVARSALFPVVTGDFNSNRQQVPTGTLASNAANNASLYSVHTAQVSVAFVPDVFGGTRRAIEAADAQLQAQSFQREAVYLTLTANIALAAIQEASTRGQLAAINRNIELQGSLVNILRRQYDRGQIALPDVVAQETAQAQNRLLLAPLEKQLAQQRDLLATLTGRFPGEGLPATFRLNSFRLPRAVPLSLPADLVRQRPDVRIAEANLHAANAQIGVAIANRLPQIMLTGNAGSSASSIGKLFSPGTGFWMVAADAAQTIFDARAREMRQRAAEAATAQAAAVYRGVVLTSFQNVADVLRALQADRRALDAALAAQRSATQSIELVRQQVEHGQVSVPNLINAQEAALQSDVAVVQARASLLADTVALFQALGGGWWNRPPPLELVVACQTPSPGVATASAPPPECKAQGN